MRLTTQAFPTAPEGDLDLCNGTPGSALAAWLRTTLVASGIPAGEPIQEDYGWGFWLAGPLAVWVAVGHCGGAQGDPADPPEWDVSATHESPLFAPRQWFRRAEGRALAQRVRANLRTALLTLPDVTRLEDEAD